MPTHVLPDVIRAPVAIATPFGSLGVIALPTLSQVSDGALEGPPPTGVHAQEWAFTKTLRGYRRATFVGGRQALHTAASAFDAAISPVLPNERGAPDVKAPLLASVSHKLDPRAASTSTNGNVAAALISEMSSESERIGVDVEVLRPRRPDIERHVLLPTEIDRLPTDLEARARCVLRAFSFKEALYKALDPHVLRYVGFREVEILPSDDDNVSFRFHLKENEGPFVAEGIELSRGQILVTLVRLRRADASELGR